MPTQFPHQNQKAGDTLRSGRHPRLLFCLMAFFVRCNYSSGFAPMTALMRRTPAEEDSSF